MHFILLGVFKGMRSCIVITLVKNRHTLIHLSRNYFRLGSCDHSVELHTVYLLSPKFAGSLALSISCGLAAVRKKAGPGSRLTRGSRGREDAPGTWSTQLNMDVSKNSGFPPKSSILIGFSISFTIHFGVPLFLETPICFRLSVLVN